MLWDLEKQRNVAQTEFQNETIDFRRVVQDSRA